MWFKILLYLRTDSSFVVLHVVMVHSGMSGSVRARVNLEIRKLFCHNGPQQNQIFTSKDPSEFVSSL